MPRTTTTATHRELKAITARLTAIEGRLNRFEVRQAKNVSTTEIRRAIEDVFETYGQVTQLREVYGTQRDEMRGTHHELASLVTLVDTLLAEGRIQDETIKGLMVQLRELARLQVAGFTDLERAVEGQMLADERRSGE